MSRLGGLPPVAQEYVGSTQEDQEEDSRWDGDDPGWTAWDAHEWFPFTPDWIDPVQMQEWRMQNIRRECQQRAPQLLTDARSEDIDLGTFELPPSESAIFDRLHALAPPPAARPMTFQPT